MHCDARAGVSHHHDVSRAPSVDGRLLRVGAAPPECAGVEDAALLARIETVFAASHQTYGSPRVHAELLATGDAPSVHGVARVMRTAGLRATRARRF
jgi:hypothetical protein